ncbi:MAG: ATP-binding protein [Clostridium sp.]|nr:ATP-binding protein [Clostridium sp.]
MKKVILICGKICSGKSVYAKQLQKKNSAVILSTDEATFDLIHNEQGEFYNVFAKRVNLYLRKKAVETVRAGANVILDWGFWTKEDRADISAFLQSNNVPYEWHYIDIDDKIWQQHIEQRNRTVQSGNGGCDFYVDDGLLKKMNTLFEQPAREQIDVWYELKD